MHNHIDAGDVKVSLFATIMTLLSSGIGLIDFQNILNGLIIALLSTLVGFYGNKGLRKLDEYLKKRKENKKKAA